MSFSFYNFRKSIPFFLCHIFMSSTFSFESAQIVKNSDGTKIAIWQTTDEVSSIQAREYSDGIWSSLHTISTTDQVSFLPKSSMNSLGNTVIGWLVIDEINGIYRLKAATKLAGLPWNAPQFISSSTEQVQNFQMKVDDIGASGTIEAIWTSINPTTNTSSVWTATCSFGGSWSIPEQLQ